jgi:hypothetical protein
MAKNIKIYIYRVIAYEHYDFINPRTWRRRRLRYTDVETKKDIRELFVYALRLSQLRIYREALERKAKKDRVESRRRRRMLCSLRSVRWNQTNRFQLLVTTTRTSCTFFRTELYNRNKSRVWS